MSLAQPPARSPKRDYNESFGPDQHSYNSIPKPEQMKADKSPQSSLPTPTSIRTEDTSMPDAGPSTPSRAEAPSSTIAPPASAPSASIASSQPPLKKPKLTFVEKEMERINKQIRDQEKAAEKERKEQEKAQRLAEKEQREAEKEAERKRKEAEKEEKRRKKEQEKKEKEEQKKRIEEEKKKKEKSQPTLSAFFGKPARRDSVSSRDSMSPAPSAPSSLEAPAASPALQTTPCKSKNKSVYEKTFPEFFLKPEVTMAPIIRFERDEVALDAIQNTLDKYILQNQSPGKHRAFDPVSLFHLPGNDLRMRGKRCIPVREIMADIDGNSSRPIDLTTDSQNMKIKRRDELLRKVPVKVLHFAEDVRPPYVGTYTSRPVSSISKLSRNFKRRDLPNTNYDYDSEAEWVEDEDADDCNSDGDEDEEGIDDMEDMDGFLDDENDENPQLRRMGMAAQGDLEPISTGLCWEDRRRRNTNVKMVAYRMEIMLSDPKVKSIDPFSTQYWEPTPISTPGNMDPPRIPLQPNKSTNTLFNMPTTASTKPVKSFFPGTQSSQSSVTATVKLHKTEKGQKKMITVDAMEDFKREVSGSDLSKVGLIEVLKKKFPKQTGAAIKGTLETIARRTADSGKEADKRWVIINEGV